MRRWYTLPEAAKILGISRQRVWMLVLEGKLRSTKVGRMWVVAEQAVQARLLASVDKVLK